MCRTAAFIPLEINCCVVQHKNDVPVNTEHRITFSLFITENRGNTGERDILCIHFKLTKQFIKKDSTNDLFPEKESVLDEMSLIA